MVRPSRTASPGLTQRRVDAYFARAPASVPDVADDPGAWDAVRRFNDGLPAIRACSDPTQLARIVYPMNGERREYQVKCVMAAVKHNSLVALPTGLGKTFIAAVLISNMLRWYPTGKCVFVAPTRALVAQQAQACCETAPIPPGAVTVLLDVEPRLRSELWSKYRVFFCAPETIQNDIKCGICPLDQIVCIVIDEAHKATGNAAMTSIVEARYSVGGPCRILALSATPGTTKADVQKLIDVLRIGDIVAFDRDSPDVKQYVKGRLEEVITVQQTRDALNIQILLDQLFERLLSALLSHNINPLPHQKYSQFYYNKEVSREIAERRIDRGRQFPILNAASALGALSFCKELLSNYSVKAFLDKAKEEFVHGPKAMSSNRRAVANYEEFTMMVALAEQTIAKNSSFHPKFDELRRILQEHFMQFGTSKAIVFTDYKTSVREICDHLNSGLQPVISAVPFIGQNSSRGSGKGMNSKEQTETLECFRRGYNNVLVATCVAEEGLDIGEVDLVVSFDSSASIKRTVQRMGRTGRKRDGRCVFLVMEGDEARAHAAAMFKRNAINKMLASKSFQFGSNFAASVLFKPWRLILGLQQKHQRPSFPHCQAFRNESSISAATCLQTNGRS
ncbi:DNA helicase [Plasmodiophora brassicae]